MAIWHCLVTIQPLKLADGTRYTVRASSANDRAICGLGGVVWEPCLTQAPSLALSLFNGDFGNAIEPGSARLPLNMDTLKKGYPLADECDWSGAPVTIYIGRSGDAWPWTQIFAGRVSDYARQAQTLALAAEVDSEPFDADQLPATYAGTGGAEGGADLKNKVKPLVIGWAMNVEPVLIDAVNNVYQFHGYGAIEAVTALYERGSDFGASVGDFAGYAALVAATIPPGRWGTCLAAGMVRLGAPAYGVITGDVKGHKVGGTTPRLTGAIIQALATIAGVNPALIETATLTALDTASPYNANLVLTDQASFADTARGLVLPLNAQAGVSLMGTFFAAKVDLAASPALTLDAQGKALPQVVDATESKTSPPYARMIFGANRSWRVHSYDEIATYATLVQRGDYSGTETYREGNIVQNQGSSWLYVNPTPTSGNAPPTLPTTSNAYWQVMAEGGADGVDGVSPPLVTLTASDRTFQYDKNGDLVAKTITFTAAKQNGSGAQTVWNVSDSAGASLMTGNAAALAATGYFTRVSDDIITMSQSQFASITNYGGYPTRDSLTVQTTYDGVTDKVTINTLRDAVVSEINDNMDYGSGAAFDRRWNTGSTAGKSTIVSSDNRGGYSIQIGDNSGNDAVNGFFDQYMGYNPEDLYEVSFDIEIVAAGASAVMYLGVDGKDRNGASISGPLGSFLYVAASPAQENANLGRKTYKGYMRGVSASGTPGYSNDIANPTPLPTGVVKIRPMFLINYNNQPGQVIIHGAGLRKVVDATVIWTGDWSSSTTYYQNDGVTYQGRSFAAKVKHTNQTPPSTATSNAYWYLVADKGAQGPQGIQGIQGLPGADGADGITHYTWVAYANAPDGSIDFTNGAPGGRAYIGISANQTSSTESTNPGDYTWSQYKGPPSFGLVGSSGVVLASNTVIKTSGVTGWDQQAYSSEGYKGGAFTSFKVPAGVNAMAGLNTDPTTNASYDSIDYAFYAAGSDLYIFEGSSNVQTVKSGTRTGNEKLSIVYDNKRIKYYVDGGTPVRDIAAPPDLTLYFDSSLYTGTTACRITEIAFGPAGPAGADGANGTNGTNGANGRDAIVYYQEAAPTSGMIIGDTWYKPSTKAWSRYNGSSWTPLLGAIASFDALNASYIVAGTIIASKFLTDQGVDLTSIVPGSLNWKVSTTDPTDYGFTTSYDSGIVAISGSGSVTPSTIVTVTELSQTISTTACSGYDINSDGFIDVYDQMVVTMDLYYRINGGGWISTGINSTYATTNAVSSTVWNTWSPFRFSPASAGTMELAWRRRIYRGGYSGASGTGRIEESHVAFEIVNWK